NRPSIVVATPGRLLDHMRRRTIRIGDVRFAVLDEADEMLNIGFIDDIRTILKNIPEQRQTLLFTATMLREVHAIADHLQKQPLEIKTKTKKQTIEDIKQYIK